MILWVYIFVIWEFNKHILHFIFLLPFFIDLQSRTSTLRVSKDIASVLTVNDWQLQFECNCCSSALTIAVLIYITQGQNPQGKVHEINFSICESPQRWRVRLFFKWVTLHTIQTNRAYWSEVFSHGLWHYSLTILAWAQGLLFLKWSSTGQSCGGE